MIGSNGIVNITRQRQKQEITTGITTGITKQMLHETTRLT